MYKKPCCDNYVEAIRSVIARILVDKKYKYSETSVMDSKCTSFTNYTYTTTWRLYQEIQKLNYRFSWVSSPSSKLITWIIDEINLLNENEKDFMHRWQDFPRRILSLIGKNFAFWRFPRKWILMIFFVNLANFFLWTL